MALSKLTFPGLELYVDLGKLISMEREVAPKTSLSLPDDRYKYTKLALSDGKGYLCTETPEQILALIIKGDTQ